MAENETVEMVLRFQVPVGLGRPARVNALLTVYLTWAQLALQASQAALVDGATREERKEAAELVELALDALYDWTKAVQATKGQQG